MSSRLFYWISAILLCLTFCSANAVDAKLGSGDVVKISVFGNPDLNLETKVSESGRITFPMIGEVMLSGATPAEAGSKIASLLKEGGFIRNPQVTVHAMQLQSQQVSVLGQVGKPGRYPVDGKRTITDVLAMAGGVGTDGGDMITIIRTRDGKTIRETINILDMVRSADINKNFDLASDDIIYVERAPRFYIYGEVQRPGAYRLERNMTVLQALSAGGGLTPRGTERGIRIKRRVEDGGMQEITVRHDDLVNVEDIVYVKESLF